MAISIDALKKINKNEGFYTEKELESEREALSRVNLTYSIEDVKKKRAGGTGMAHNLLLKNTSSEELLFMDVKMVAENHKNLLFNLELDGINAFKIYCNGELILGSDFYFFEQCMQKDYKTFRNLLEERVTKKTR